MTSSREATVIYVTKFERPLAAGELPGPETGYQDLDGAAEAASAVASEFATAGYRVQVVAEPDGVALGRAVEDALSATASDALQIVHVVSHASISREIDKLHVLGRGGAAHTSTIVERWLESVEFHSSSPMTLFVLDTCYAGSTTVYPWAARRVGSAPRALVLAASSWDGRAYEYRLSRALAQLLASSEDLDGFPSLPHLKWDLVARALADRIADLSTADYPQQATSTPLDPAIVDFDTFAPFFPNPRFVQPTPTEIVRNSATPALAPFLDGIDVAHFHGRALGHQRSLNSAALFRGRALELHGLSDWLDAPVGDDHLRVVVGEPGSGKSAILGIIVCSGVERLREVTRAAWSHLPRVPGPINPIAAVHARNRSLAEIASSVAEQLRLDIGLGEKWSARTIISAIEGMPSPPTIVVDALDESEDAGSVSAVLLRPLVNARRPDGAAACRLVVGTRAGVDWPATQSLVAACAPNQLVDLSSGDRVLLRADLWQFANDALLAGPAWSQASAETIRNVADSLSDALSAPQPDNGWGEFLIAGLFIDYLLESVRPDDESGVATALRAIPSTLPEVLELDLRSDPGDRRRSLLTAFSLARGEGMPLALATDIANGLTPGAFRSLKEARAALNEIQFFLRMTPEVDGSTAYRPFHQGIADHLRAPLDASAFGSVVDAIVAHRTSASGAQIWSNSSPYLKRHFLSHASDAGAAITYLSKPEILVISDPVSVRATLRTTRSEPRAIASIYRAAPLSETSEDERRDILALGATGYGNHELADALSKDPESKSGWAPVWSTVAGADDASRDVLAGHRGSVHSVACGMMDGRPIAVSASNDRTMCVWDVESGTLIGTPFSTPLGALSSVAMLKDGSLVAGGTNDGQLLVWDLAKGIQLSATKALHIGPVNAVDVAVFGDEVLAVTGGRDSTVRVWDLASGTLLCEAGVGHHGPINAVLCLETGGQKLLITAGRDRFIGIWDLRSRSLTAKIATGHRGSITSLAYAEVQGRPIVVSASADGAIGMWDIGTGEEVRGKLSGHSGAVNSIAVASVGGRKYAVSGGVDRTVRWWDLDAGEQTAAFAAGHLGAVNALATTDLDGRQVAVSGSNDGTLRIWDLTQKAPPSDRPPGYVGRVKGTSLVRLDDTPSAVTVSGGNEIRVWNLSNGDQVGQVHKVTGGALRALAASSVEGRPVVAIASGDGILRVWDFKNSEPRVGDSSGGAPMNAIACTVVGGRAIAVTGSADGVIRLWDVATGEMFRGKLTGHSGWVNTIACTHLGGLPVAVSGGADGTVRLWDLTSGTAIGQPLVGHKGWVRSVACLTVGDRSIVVSGGRDHSLRMWDLNAPENSGVKLGEHADWVNVVQCGTVNQRPVAISGGRDNTLRTWDLSDGKPLAKPLTLGREVVSLVLSEQSLNDGPVLIGLERDVALYRWRESHLKRER